MQQPGDGVGDVLRVSFWYLDIIASVMVEGEAKIPARHDVGIKTSTI